jgi:hypothetical protein
MAISRPFLLALLGAVLLGATAFAVQNSRTTADGDAAPAAVQADPAPAASQTSTSTGPEATLSRAFQLGDLESARFSASVTFASGSQRVGLDLAGAFQEGAPNDLPEFDLHARIALAGQTLRGGFVSLGDKAYFTRGDDGWRVPATVWDPLVENAAKGGRSQALPLDVHPSTWVRDVKSEGSDQVSGVKTDHVSATVDPKRVVQDLAKAAGNVAGLPSSSQATRSVKRAELDVWVGSDDHLLRRLSGEIAFAGRGTVTVDVRLADVNEPQHVKAPAHLHAGLPGGVLGQLAEGIVGGINRVSGAPRTSLAALTSRNPQRAARAVRAHKKVVILFRNPRGLDDRAMEPVMRQVAGRTKAVVLTDHVDAVERYGKLVEDLGVSQTPSVVIIDRSGEARLFEGYLDADTLTQAVSDTR